MSCFRASPNLALVKYWGKADSQLNLPATSSLGITLAGLQSVASVAESKNDDTVLLNGSPADLSRYSGFFSHLRTRLKTNIRFNAQCSNSFPTGAGLASSSSGFASLAAACANMADSGVQTTTISALARIGSASAARSVYGGFVALPAGAFQAEQLFPPDFWTDCRIVLVAVSRAEKPVSSRAAMEITRLTSPAYPDWVRSSRQMFSDACRAVDGKDIEKLGTVMRLSYLRMFATMMSASPPILYWLPESLQLIRLCEQIRSEGIQAWETMDAGPQVKVLCLKGDVPAIIESMRKLNSNFNITVARPGEGITPVETES